MKMHNAMTEKEMIRKFFLYYDGVPNYVEPISKFDSYNLGITNLKKIDDSSLEVTLRRPGLLIGKAGTSINAAEEDLGFKLKIVEKKFY